MAMCRTSVEAVATTPEVDAEEATLSTEGTTTTFMATMCTVTTIMRLWRRGCIPSRAIRGGIETIWGTRIMRETRLRGAAEVATANTITTLRVHRADAIEVEEAQASMVRRTSTSMRATMKVDMTTISEAASSLTRKVADAAAATTTVVTKVPKAR